jgi:hypothetical protein
MVTFSGWSAAGQRLTPVDDYLIHQTAAPLSEMGYGDRALGWNEHQWFGVMPRSADEPFVVTQLMLYPNAGVTGHLRAAAYVSHREQIHYFTFDRPLHDDRTNVSAGPLVHEWLEPGSRHRVTLAPNEHVGVSFDLILERRQETQLGPCMELLPGTKWTHTMQWLRVTRGEVRVGGSVYNATGFDVWRDHCWGNSPYSAGVQGENEPHICYAFGTIPLKDRTVEMAYHESNSGAVTASWARTVWDDGRVEYAQAVELDMHIDAATRKFTKLRWVLETEGRRDAFDLDPQLQGVILSDRDYGADLGPAWAERPEEEQGPVGRTWLVTDALRELPVTGMHASAFFRHDQGEEGTCFMEWMCGAHHPRAQNHPPEQQSR